MTLPPNSFQLACGCVATNTGLSAGQDLLDALDTDQYGKVTDYCIKALEAAIAKATQ